MIGFAEYIFPVYLFISSAFIISNLGNKKVRKKTYSFVLGGITRKGDSTATTVKGYFDAPEIADELKSSEASDEETEETEHDQENSQKRHPNAESETGTSTETPDEKQTSEGSAKMTEAKQQETEDAKTSIESSTQKDTDNGGGQN